MKKFSKVVVALCAALALVFGFASCDNGSGGENDPAEKTYTITIASGIEHGTVTVSTATATAGTEITLTATADNGYELGPYTVTTEDGSTVSVTDGKFTMPINNVTVSATFEASFVKVTGATVSGAVLGPEGLGNVLGSSNSFVFIEGRTVTIGDLWVCIHEVTQGEYETYCNYGGDSPSSNSDKKDYGVGENFPAYYVSRFDAIVYCNLRSMAEGLEPVYKIGDETDPTKWTDIVSDRGKYCGPSEKNDTWDGITMVGNTDSIVTTANGYRLPTEAEWEYVARGGNGGIPETQYTYSGSNTIDEVAWYKDNSDSKAHKVKTKKANTLGIYDMSGNVWEWCWDWYSDNITSSRPVSVSGASSRTLHLRESRGGEWNRIAIDCKVERLYCYPPQVRGVLNGFRVVRNAQETQ